MIRIRSRMGMVMAIAGSVSAGCGGGAPDAASTESTPPPGSSQTASKPAKNACALVNRAEIEAVAGQKLDMLHNIEADDKTICELSEATSNTVLVYVTVYWRGGKEIARTNQAAMSMAKQMMNSDDVDIEALTGSEKVRGLADKAYYSNLMPSWVLKGDVLIEVISPRFANDQTRRVFLSVARAALPRL